MKRRLICSVTILLMAALATEGVAQPTDKRPPGVNRPVGDKPDRPGRPGNGSGPNPGRPNPPRPKPPGATRPPPRPNPTPGKPHRPRPANHRPHNRFPTGAYRRPGGYFFRQWGVGALLPSLFRVQSYWLSAPGAYGLRPPPPGTRWVRVDNDALLVSNRTGRIIEIVHDIFY